MVFLCKEFPSGLKGGTWFKVHTIVLRIGSGVRARQLLHLMVGNRGNDRCHYQIRREILYIALDKVGKMESGGIVTLFTLLALTTASNLYQSWLLSLVPRSPALPDY